MRRRDCSMLLVGAAFWPLQSFAQGSATRPLVAYLGIASRASDQPYVDGLRLGFDEIGFVPGETIQLEDHYADGSVEGFGALVADVVARGVSVVVVPGIAAAVAMPPGWSTRRRPAAF